MPELRFRANTFADVVDFLRDVSGMNIFANWNELTEDGVDRDTPVTVVLKNVTLATALDLTLQSAGGHIELAYSVEGGVIRITTAARARNRVVIQTYDVSGLATTDAEMAQLKSMVMNDVDGPSWRANGGTIGTTEVFRSKLIVTQTQFNQQRIAALLQSLKEMPVVGGVGSKAASEPTVSAKKM